MASEDRDLLNLLNQIEQAGPDASLTLKQEARNMRNRLGSVTQEDADRSNLMFRARYAGGRVNGQPIQAITDDEWALLGVDRKVPGPSLIGQQNIRGGGGGQQGIIGAQRQDAPPEYIYRDLKTGETYDPFTDSEADPLTDIMYSDSGGGVLKRKVVNPEYQEWVVRRAEEIARENMAKNAGSGQGATRVPDARVLAEYKGLLEERRGAQTPQDQAKYDEQIQAYQRAYPMLAQSIGGTGGAGGGVDITGEQAAQALQQAGVPPETVQKIIGQEIGKVRPKPTWDWQSEVTVGDRQSDAQARREFR